MAVEIEMDGFIDIDLSSSGKVLPQKNDKIALIDADTIVFGACTVKEFVEAVTEDDEGNLVEIYDINLDEAYQHAVDKINDILTATGCQDFELHFTVGRKSFRYTRVDEEYKANRVGGRAPKGLYELKKLFVERNPDKAFMWSEFEADDVVIVKKKNYVDKYILCAVDKDVLYCLPGTHFNYYSRADYNIEMKFITVEEDAAMKHLYFQVLMGDSGDNVIGLKGVGKVTANKLLAECTTAKECEDVVMKAYEDKGRCITDFIKNMRLISMHQLKELGDNQYEVHLWKPENYGTRYQCVKCDKIYNEDELVDAEHDGDLVAHCASCGDRRIFLEV